MKFDRERKSHEMMDEVETRGQGKKGGRYARGKEKKEGGMHVVRKKRREVCTW
jgi:hypothetical protein